MASSCEFGHESVLLYETVAAVLGVLTDNTRDIQATLGALPKVSGVFVDATFGRGGHSSLLLQYLAKDARLIVFDKDVEAIQAAKALAIKDARVSVVHGSFANLQQELQSLGIHQVAGIMADLGVSSPQLDDGTRGFSFNKSGAIDMRMDTTRGQTVGEWLAVVSEEVLADVLYEYGEERHSRRIARAIKAMDCYDDTLTLAEVIKSAHPNWQKGKHPATKSFQAMRIFINNELGDVDEFLAQTIEVLQAGGQLAVISFHSLEDRRIKRFLHNHSRGQWEGDDRLLMPPTRPKYFTKPLRLAPNKTEIANNPRARSAYLRTATRAAVCL